jgi:uncharacterized membrane protein
MATGALLAYPLLLGAVYGVFRVGRREGIARRSRMEWLRLGILSVFLVVITLLQIRFAVAGIMSSSWAVFVGVASLAAALGMVGIQGFEMIEAWEKKRPEPAAAAVPNDS